MRHSSKVSMQDNQCKEIPPYKIPFHHQNNFLLEIFFSQRIYVWRNVWYNLRVKNNGIKVFVGVSGGVDSSVALALLSEQGYDVTGVFLKVWHPDWLPCDWKEERRSAMRVCATLGVPFLTLDCTEEYKREVVDYMIREYSAGRVPNPDVFCNKYVKFGVFLDKALTLGADFIATGHYAQVCQRQSLTQTFELCESVDGNKDQSYFLYTLDQRQLSHTLFPVGDMTKPEVRKLAEKFGLPTAAKKDSQGLCFIGKVDMKDFLQHYITPRPGLVLNIVGEAIGRHDGALFYTIGERHGFTITRKTPNDPRLFVVAKDVEKNTITIGDTETEAAREFDVREIIVPDLHFISGSEPTFPFASAVRIRYRQEKQSCIVTKNSDGYHITFDTPQSGVPIGQSAVLYESLFPQSVCLGGGIIDAVV